MSYTELPKENNPEKEFSYNFTPTKKDNRNTIYAILIGALLCTWGYIIYDKSKTKEERIQLVDRIVQDSVDRAALQFQFNLLSSKADSITLNNQQLQGSLAEKNNEIIKLKNNIAVILKNKNASAAELSEAKKQLQELQNKIEALYAEIEVLKAENKQLTATNTQLNNEKKQLSEEKQELETNLDKTKKEKEKVEDLASTLHVSNINITAINLKGNKEKETTKAKKADYFKISFDIDENYVAPSGHKTFMVCVYYPDGTLSQSSGSFTNREGTTISYTQKIELEYTQGKKTNTSFEWKPGNKLQTGVYKIEVYNNGFKIGEGTKSLDRSTFLGL